MPIISSQVANLIFFIRTFSFCYPKQVTFKSQGICMCGLESKIVIGSLKKKNEKPCSCLLDSTFQLKSLLSK